MTAVRSNPEDAPVEANAYVGAYPFLKPRRAIWEQIVDYVLRDAVAAPGGDLECVVELGAGYCDFINAIPAKRRVAFDLNPEMQSFADPEVDLRIADARRLGDLPAGSVDLVFASNFFEHLEGGEVDELLEVVHQSLRPGGRLMLIQPNHRLCADRYFEDPTHVTVFDDANIGPWLARHGFEIARLVPGLLPFSMKSRAPKWPQLVWLYLRSPIRPLAAQMYVVAERS